MAQKSNIHKKMTFEDKFDRKYACWVVNNPKAWRYWKVRNRRLFRKKMNRRQRWTDEKDN
jgi:hypothetical protein